MHHMTVKTPPLGALVGRNANDQCGRIGGPVSDASSEAGLLGTEQHLSDRRMNAVRADDQQRFGTTAVRKRESGARFMMLDRDQFFAKVDALARRERCES